ncbi:uncharacterized protein LOC126273295 [Schistocerca gregaria]|uniref:uncharacterized protein LOC126273295 n=1 Tax=Schistocerca gregaria TaxID=7010 RepID=UPI00211E2070|nr:uncharacterized protein LOC126273295 [Schistocerca gregaria]
MAACAAATVGHLPPPPGSRLVPYNEVRGPRRRHLSGRRRWPRQPPEAGVRRYCRQAAPPPPPPPPPAAPAASAHSLSAARRPPHRQTGAAAANKKSKRRRHSAHVGWRVSDAGRPVAGGAKADAQTAAASRRYYARLACRIHLEMQRSPASNESRRCRRSQGDAGVSATGTPTSVSSVCRRATCRSPP